jgi:hypothetical protein
MVRPQSIVVIPVLTNSTTRTRSSNSSIRVIRLRSIRDGKEAVRLASTIDTKMEELTRQGIPTSRQEEEVNGNSRKGEPGVPGKEGDYIVEWRGWGLDVHHWPDMQHYDRIADLGREPSVDVESIEMEHRVDAQAELQWTCEGTSAGWAGLPRRLA